ncbi:hypothetical protein Bca4012_064412 [Brassica carinata]|uniref:At2g35280-like TPR domain-containing protein n=1 Tax=Brassica carinata TaxID=52824 RepID=A0A8X7VM34_BRACI|nr:hypothetical protein Bca52824_016903 [Brassica carinata]
MEPTNPSLPRLDTMPDDMLRLIISKVGSSSSTDYGNTMLTCKSLNFGLDDPLIAKTLSIAPLVKKPHLAHRYEKLMESLLAVHNLDAHYVTGMRECFLFDNHFLGLHHLRLASKGGHKEAEYLYGILHMALGWIEEGKKILSKLTDDEGLAFVELSWENIQTSLSQLNVRMRDEYVASFMIMQPDVDCHPRVMNTVCHKCYHAYLMSEFFDMVLGLNPVPAAAVGA